MRNKILALICCVAVILNSIVSIGLVVCGLLLVFEFTLSKILLGVLLMTVGRGRRRRNEIIVSIFD